MPLMLHVCLLFVVAGCVARAAPCDDVLSCTECLAVTGCSWCPVDGIGMCVPQAWSICDHEEKCAKHQTKREFEEPNLCRVSLCGGATFDQFLSTSPCIKGTSTVTCKACLGSQPATWHCYAPLDYDSGFQCNTPADWSDPQTANRTWTEYCEPLNVAAPSVAMKLPTGAFSANPAGVAAVEKLTILLTNGSSFDIQADGSLLLDLSVAPQDFVESLQEYVANLATIALSPLVVAPSDIIITKVLLSPTSKRQSSLDNYDVTIQFSLLKGDDPVASDALATQFVSALVQGVVAGVDPVSVSSTPATTPQFPTPNGNVTTPRPTEVAKPRDPSSPLNGGALFGIIFGSAVGLVIILGGIAWCFVKYRASHSQPFQPAQATL